jgi:hypothetical protein
MSRETRRAAGPAAWRLLFAQWSASRCCRNSRQVLVTRLRFECDALDGRAAVQVAFRVVQRPTYP